MSSQASNGKNRRIYSLRKAWRIFLDIISFNTPFARVFDLSSILIFLSAAPLSLIENSPVKCVFKTYLLPLVFGGICPESGIFAGCNCLGCGMTRAIWHILHGDLAGAYALNAMAFLVLSVMLTIILIDFVSLLRKRLFRAK